MLRSMADDEERIALFLDYENLAIGARDHLRGMAFDFKPVADALAERGRVVVRRGYADWSYFDEDRRELTRHHVELIEIPQRMGSVRKNAADIKLAVDAVELSFERDYITTFVVATGDSDFTPLVHALRARNKSVIGIGVKDSTSNLLPPACDEFLFYDHLEGVEPRAPRRRSRRRGRRTKGPGAPESRARGDLDGAGDAEATDESVDETEEAAGAPERPELEVLISQTLAGLKRTRGDVVLASNLKRTLLRKDPTFSEADYGFRGFRELLRHLAGKGVIELGEGPASGDPDVDFPEDRLSGEEQAFSLLRSVVTELQGRDGPVVLSGLKDQLRRHEPEFTEKRFGYGGFLQFVKAASARGIVELRWDDDADDYVLDAAG